jgi:hypothetical protein
MLACVSIVMSLLIWWLHFRARRRTATLPSYCLAIDILGLGVIALTGHLRFITNRNWG